MTETLTAPQETFTPQKHVPEQYEVQYHSQDFHLPGDSHVSKHTYYDTASGEAVRKVITPNHLGQLEIKFVPQSEVIQVRNSESYDHTPRH